MQLTDSVSTLKGIGAARLAKLTSIGILTIQDLLEYFPRDYIDRSETTPIAELEQGMTVTVRGKFTGEFADLRYSGGVRITKGVFADNSGGMDMVWFNQPYIAKSLKAGCEYVCSGKVTKRVGRMVIENPEYERHNPKDEGDEAAIAALSAGRIVPIYPLTEGISQKLIRPLIRQAIDGAASLIEDFLPVDIIRAHGLMPRAEAVSNLHFPESDAVYLEARRRLVFEELFLMQAALLNLRGFYANAPGHKFKKLDAKIVLDALPFKLTSAQAAVHEEICRDLASGLAMNRLIQGDVGSGKTAVAMLVCAHAANNGFQSALLAPTETLATQHYQGFLEIFGGGLSVALLVGSQKKKEKDAIKARLASGEIDIIIGTHALIQENVTFANLGLTVCDEQHRFGVRQRQAIGDKGRSPHMLVMTATPIPRSLAMVLYGDMDISIINQLPPGRQKIDTHAVPSSYHPRIFKFIREQLHSGSQAYIICPLIDESEKEGMADIRAVNKFAQLLEGEFEGYRLEVMHGRLKPAEKNAVMSSFAAGDAHILLSTTVVEVGVNVPNATVILIENAERFGLSQLHQLRGRVGRSDKKSYCVLITDSKNKITKSRMKAMTSTNDGFELSELDLKLRGPGEFFGTAQHGIPAMRLANMYRDMPILEQTKNAAMSLISDDPDLCDEKNRPLGLRIRSIASGYQKISL